MVAAFGSPVVPEVNMYMRGSSNPGLSSTSGREAGRVDRRSVLRRLSLLTRSEEEDEDSPSLKRATEGSRSGEISDRAK